MKMKTYTAIFFILLFPLFAFSQSAENKISISFNWNYTTTSKLFLQPNYPDPIVRSIHEDLDHIYSYFVEVRYQLMEAVFIGAGSEYIKKTFKKNINLSGTRIPTEDGYRMVPFELSIYYQLPFSSEHFKFFMGGGSGIYFGEHIRNLGNVTISNESRKASYGIHVAVGMEYIVNNLLSFRGQMRFRDPEVEMKSRYSSSFVNYNGKEYLLPSQSFESKVNIDGIVFTIGAVINF